MKRPLLFFLALGTMVVSRVTWAQAPNAQVAESLFQEGIALICEGKTREACEKFASSYRLDPANGTLQNVASCHEKDGRTATAWSEWLELAGKAARAGQKDREQLARTRAAELSKNLCRLELKFPLSPNVADVVVDEQPVLRDAWSTALPLDPGPHVVTFKAPGKRPVSANVVMTAGKTASLDVPLLADDESSRAVAPPTPPVTSTVTTAERPSTGSSSRRTAGIVVGSVGVLALGAGAFFGVRAITLENDAKCADEVCDTPADAATRDDAKSSATFSTIGIGVGLVAIGVGVYLLLTSDPATPQPARAAQLHGKARSFPLTIDGLGLGARW